MGEPDRRRRRRFGFQLSGFSREEKQSVQMKIEALGGAVLEGDHFMTDCTHVLIKKPSRSEKFLGACATGIWVLCPTFIEESYRKGRFQGEEQHEWGPDKRSLVQACPESLALLEAPAKWRKNVAAIGQRAFVGWKCAVLVENKPKQSVYKRLLESGGAVLENIEMPITSTIANAAVERRLTHIIAEDSQQNQLQRLIQRRMFCIKPIYIGDYLTMDPLPDPADYLIGKVNVDRRRTMDISLSSAPSTPSSTPVSTPLTRGAVMLYLSQKPSDGTKPALNLSQGVSNFQSQRSSQRHRSNQSTPAKDQCPCSSSQATGDSRVSSTASSKSMARTLRRRSSSQDFEFVTPVKKTRVAGQSRSAPTLEQNRLPSDSSSGCSVSSVRSAIGLRRGKRKRGCDILDTPVTTVVKNEVQSTDASIDRLDACEKKADNPDLPSTNKKPATAVASTLVSTRAASLASEPVSSKSVPSCAKNSNVCSSPSSSVSSLRRRRMKDLAELQVIVDLTNETRPSCSANMKSGTATPDKNAEVNKWLKSSVLPISLKAEYSTIKGATLLVNPGSTPIKMAGMLGSKSNSCDSSPRNSVRSLPACQQSSKSTSKGKMQNNAVAGPMPIKMPRVSGSKSNSCDSSPRNSVKPLPASQQSSKTTSKGKTQKNAVPGATPIKMPGMSHGKSNSCDSSPRSRNSVESLAASQQYSKSKSIEKTPKDGVPASKGKRRSKRMTARDSPGGKKLLQMSMTSFFSPNKAEAPLEESTCIPPVPPESRDDDKLKSASLVLQPIVARQLMKLETGLSPKHSSSDQDSAEEDCIVLLDEKKVNSKSEVSMRESKTSKTVADFGSLREETTQKTLSPPLISEEKDLDTKKSDGFNFVRSPIRTRRRTWQKGVESETRKPQPSKVVDPKSPVELNRAEQLSTENSAANSLELNNNKQSNPITVATTTSDIRLFQMEAAISNGCMPNDCQDSCDAENPPEVRSDDHKDQNICISPIVPVHSPSSHDITGTPPVSLSLEERPTQSPSVAAQTSTESPSKFPIVHAVLSHFKDCVNKWARSPVKTRKMTLNSKNNTPSKDLDNVAGCSTSMTSDTVQHVQGESHDSGVQVDEPVKTSLQASQSVSSLKKDFSSDNERLITESEIDSPSKFKDFGSLQRKPLHGVKRQLLTEPEGSKTQKLFHSRPLPWIPSCALLGKKREKTSHSSQKAESMSMPISDTMTAFIEVGLEDSRMSLLCDVMLSNITSCRYPQASTLYGLMKRVLLVSQCPVDSKRVYSTLMKVLLMHPPTSTPLQMTYLRSFHEKGNAESSKPREEWCFVKAVCSQMLTPSTDTCNQDAYNNFLLFKFIVHLLEADLEHHMFDLKSFSEDDGTKSYTRVPLLSRMLWPMGQKPQINAASQEIVGFLIETIQLDDSSPHRLEMFKLLQTFSALTGECLRLAHMNKGDNRPISLGDIPEQACLFARELAFRIHSDLDEARHRQEALQGIKLPWLGVKVSHMLLDLYDDSLLPIDLADPTLIVFSLKTVVSRYMFLLPPLSQVASASPLKKLSQPGTAVCAKTFGSPSTNTKHLKTQNSVLGNAPSTSQQAGNQSKNSADHQKKTLVQGKNLDPALNRKIAAAIKRNAKGETPLHIACRKNNVAKVKELLLIPGIDVNVVDYSGWTPLHEACNHNSVDCVLELAKYRPVRTITSYFKTASSEELNIINLKAASADGITPLHDAVMNDNIEIAKLLLQYGGKSLLSVQTKDGLIPMDYVETEEMKDFLEQPHAFCVVNCPNTPSKKGFFDMSFSQSFSQGSSQGDSQSFYHYNGPSETTPSAETYDVVLANKTVSPDVGTMYIFIMFHLLQNYIRFYQLGTIRSILRNSCKLPAQSGADAKLGRGQKSPRKFTIPGSQFKTLCREALGISASMEYIQQVLDDVKTLREMRFHVKRFQAHIDRIVRQGNIDYSKTMFPIMKLMVL